MENSKNKEIKNIKKLGIAILLLFMVFFITKFKVIELNTGVIGMILIFISLNFISANLYFNSKVTKFFVYIFSLLDMTHFMISNFSLKTILFFLIYIFVLMNIMLKIEGKNNSSSVFEYIIIYVILKILLITMFLFLNS